MSCLHLSLFLATATAAAHDINPVSARSLSTVNLHVCLGRPRFLSKFFNQRFMSPVSDQTVVHLCHVKKIMSSGALKRRDLTRWFFTDYVRTDLISQSHLACSWKPLQHTTVESLFSWTLDFFNLPITRSKTRFPPVRVPSVYHCNFTPDFSNVYYPISQTELLGFRFIT